MTIIRHEVLTAYEDYNETAVRFHFIDPVLRALGYPGPLDTYLEFEEKLDYPYYHIGHKSKKDLPLGFPDYRAGLKGRRGSFIVEAKAPSARISKATIEQAHSYAAHSQVGANYFLLCDGIEFQLFETLSGSESSPISLIPASEINDRFHELENILSPSSLARNCQISYDAKLKLCDGLASKARIRSGLYEMDKWEYRILINGEDQTEFIKSSVPSIQEVDDQMLMLRDDFELRVSEGVAQRDDDGRIFATTKFAGVTKNNTNAMQQLGIDRLTFYTNDRFLSTDPNSPSVFESVTEFSIEEGAHIATGLFGSTTAAPTPIKGDMFVSALMHKNGDRIIGKFSAKNNITPDLGHMGNVMLEFFLVGGFTLELDYQS